MKRKVGRPSTGAKRSLTIHLTPKQFKCVNKYSKETRVSRAYVIRHLVDLYFAEAK